MRNRRLVIVAGFSFVVIFFVGAFFVDRKINSGIEGEILPLERTGRDITPPSLKINSYSLSWTLATGTALWEARDSAASFVFQNKIWMMGGLDGSGKVVGDGQVKYWEAPHFNDVWTTQDGINWKQEAKKSFWLPRRSMSVVEFRGRLWMFGGWSPIEGYTRDVWASDDGVAWKKIVSSAPWPAREGQMVEVFDGKIFMMGGVNYDERKEKNDVWYSADGVNWSRATGTMLWAPRWDHATAVFNNKLYLTGGMNLSGATFMDVWMSDDGINWRLVTDSPAWPSRQGHALIPLKGYLWLLGRLNDTEGGGENDVWFSSDGLNWEKTAVNPPWTGREDFSYAVLDDKIYVFAGMDKDWRWRNDVWIGEVSEK